MEDTKKKFKGRLIVLIIIFSILLLFVAATYLVMKWIIKSVNDNVKKYYVNITINEDGSISTGVTPQQLWDEMLKKEYEVDKYLDGPEELSYLMNAEVTTQIPDTTGESLLGGYVISDKNGSLAALYRSIKTTSVKGTNYDNCAGWVNKVFYNAGFGAIKGHGAKGQCRLWCHSTNKDDLKPGMVIAVTTTGSSGAGGTWGHIGIYIGNDQVVHNTTVGTGYYHVDTMSFDKWCRTYGAVEHPQWGWFGGIELE